MLDSAKGSIDVHVWAGMPHVFPSSIAILTAADEALDDIGAFLRKSFDRG
jgi:acetyl esterase/lipase